MKRLKTEYTIIGGGITGCSLAWWMNESAIDFKLIDFEKGNDCSVVAGGLINPIVFKKLVKTWMADELIPFNMEFYKEIEDICHSHFLNLTPIYKILNTEHEAIYWNKQRLIDGNDLYMSRSGVNVPNINTSFSGGLVNGGGFVDLGLFLKSVKQKFSESIYNCFVSHSEIKIENNGFIITLAETEVHTEKIIFCEGNKVVRNPWFNYLPFAPVKGEMLLVKIPELNLNHIVNKGCFIIPRGNDLYHIGSTFDWENVFNGCTESGKLELIKKLESVISIPYEIVDHFSGIRPAINDRRPLIGEHPDIPNMFIVNGMGSKGVTLAPYFTNLLLKNMVVSQEIPEEVGISRFNKHYLKAIG